jgi:hypothetical protein
LGHPPSHSRELSPTCEKYSSFTPINAWYLYLQIQVKKVLTILNFINHGIFEDK